MRPSTRVLQFRPASRSHGAPDAVDNELKDLEIDSATPLIGESEVVTLLDAFEGGRLLGGLCARRAANQCADRTTRCQLTSMTTGMRSSDVRDTNTDMSSGIIKPGPAKYPNIKSVAVTNTTPRPAGMSM